MISEQKFSNIFVYIFIILSTKFPLILDYANCLLNNWPWVEKSESRIVRAVIIIIIMYICICIHIYVYIYRFNYIYIFIYSYIVQSTDTCFAVLQLISVAWNNLNEFHHLLKHMRQSVTVQVMTTSRECEVRMADGPECSNKGSERCIYIYIYLYLYTHTCTLELPVLEILAYFTL